MPVERIDRSVVVEEIASKKLLSPSPVDQTVFGDKRGDDHPQAVVHISSRLKLLDRGIDEWISGLSLFDLGDEVWVVLPDDRSTLVQKLLIVALGEIVHDMIPKLSPSKLTQKTRYTTIAVSTIDLPWTHKPKSQIRREARGAIEYREVTSIVVGVWVKMLESRLEIRTVKIRMPIKCMEITEIDLAIVSGGAPRSPLS